MLIPVTPLIRNNQAHSIMKRKFYFHRQNAELQPDHVIYVVWVGESVKEQRILTQLVAWSFEHGATLMSWREDIDYYLENESQRVFPGRGLLDFGFAKAHINAEDLLILMRDNSFEAFEAALTTPKAYFQQIHCLDPIRLHPKAINQKINHVLTSPRKNLSQLGGAKPVIISFI